MTKLLAEAVLVQLTLHSGQNSFPKVEFLISKGAKKERKKEEEKKKEEKRKKERKIITYCVVVPSHSDTMVFFIVFI